ncbi:MAG: tRNA uridine-5-carboxymethylaminomethyl(34) synthesis GTPase MnmE [Pseudomonadota bacterium]
MSRGVSSKDTIAALATPPGRGGIGIVRISGTGVANIAAAVLGKLPKPRKAWLTDFVAADGSVLDRGIALFFPGPDSFTGEDVLELQGHGGPVVMDMLLERVVDAGARIALPGEFSERAFLNDKIDLTQAEAIADLIDSVSQQAARGAVRSLAGEFRQRIDELSEKMIGLRMLVEAAIDFPEEEIDFLDDDRIGSALVEIQKILAATLAEASQGALLREGISLVIVGRPNAGKSSLMNQLTGNESSIVTSVPGTTRDLVREHIHIDGIPLRLVDTAGLRQSPDEVEAEGIRRALQAASAADQVLLVIDASLGADQQLAEVESLKSELASAGNVTVVLNKVDLVDSVRQRNLVSPLLVSAKTGEGLDKLKAHIKRLAGFDSAGEGSFTARRRHLDALRRAEAALVRGHQELLQNKAGELLAEELRLAHESLCEITGEFSSDDLLGKIFSSFCIGK